MIRSFCSLLLVIFLAFSFKTVFAQQKGSISGEITDKVTQAYITGVVVRVLGTNLGAETGSDGRFRIINIPVGTYEVEFTDVSYKRYVESDVVVLSGKDNQFNVELEGITTEEVLVEDSRFQKPVDASTSFKSLTFEEVRRSPGGFEDIGRVIQTLPGLSLTNDGRNDIIVRGGSPAENLFVVDGFQTNNINHFGTQGATGGPISIINLDFLREVSFLTGGFSAKYGDRLSSVVDIKLRDGNQDRFFGKVNLSGIGFGANFEGPLPTRNKGSWIVSARRSYLDIIFNASGFSFVPEYTDFQGKLHYHINNRNFLTFSGFGALDKVRFNNDTEENTRDNERILTNNQNSYSAGVGWKSLLTSRSYSVVSVSRNFVNYFFSQRDAGFKEIFRNASREGDVILKVEYNNQFSGVTFFSTAASAQTIKLDYDIHKEADTLDYTDPATGKRVIVPELTVLQENRTYKFSAYGEVVQKVLKNHKLTAGLRYDRFELIRKKDYFSPRISASISVLPKLSLNLAYGIFYQSPSYVWIVSYPGNDSLTNIRADHYVAGVEYFLDETTRLVLEGYYKIYKNYPVSTVRPYVILANTNGFETQNSFGLEPLQSTGKGFSRGIELYIQKALTRSLYGTVSLSLFEVRYTALDGIERRSDYDNRYVFNVNGGYRFSKGWELSMKFRLAGGRPYTPINSADGSLDYTQYNTLTYPVYNRLDIRAEKKWSFSKWTLITYVDVQNVYNKKNLYEYRWDDYKKEIVTNTNIGILPSIGVSAEF